MRKRTILATLAMAAVAINASAQLKNNSDGYNRIQASFAAGRVTESIDGSENLNTRGASLSYISGVNLTTKIPLFLEIGGRLTFTKGSDDVKGYDEEDDNELLYKYEQTNTLMDISVPCNLAYKIAFYSSGVEIIPFFGPNFKFNLIGKQKTKEMKYGETTETTCSFYDEDDMGDNKAKRFQFGLNLGVGFRLNSIYLGYQIQPDLSPYVKFDNYKLKTFSQLVSLGIYL